MAFVLDRTSLFVYAAYTCSCYHNARRCSNPDLCSFLGNKSIHTLHLLMTARWNRISSTPRYSARVRQPCMRSRGYRNWSSLFDDIDHFRYPHQGAGPRSDQRFGCRPHQGAGPCSANAQVAAPTANPFNSVTSPALHTGRMGLVVHSFRRPASFVVMVLGACVVRCGRERHSAEKLPDRCTYRLATR
jgi:hypothetical protein